MLFHTIVNELDILGLSSVEYKIEALPIEGGIVEAVNVNGSLEVRRLISTDPYLYLDNKYSPHSNCKKKSKKKN